MKKLLVSVFVIFSLVLTGCSTGGSPEIDQDAGTQSQDLYERTIELKDGREITCIIYRSQTGKSGGLSCDWGD